MKITLAVAATLIGAFGQSLARAEEEPPSDWNSLVKGDFFPGGTIQQKLLQAVSPDGRSVAVRAVAKRETVVLSTSSCESPACLRRAW